MFAVMISKVASDLHVTAGQRPTTQSQPCYTTDADGVVYIAMSPTLGLMSWLKTNARSISYDQQIYTENHKK